MLGAGRSEEEGADVDRSTPDDSSGHLLEQIEAGLAYDDPRLAEAFRRWAVSEEPELSDSTWTETVLLLALIGCAAAGPLLVVLVVAIVATR